MLRNLLSNKIVKNITLRNYCKSTKLINNDLLFLLNMDNKNKNEDEDKEKIVNELLKSKKTDDDKTKINFDEDENNRYNDRED